MLKPATPILTLLPPSDLVVQCTNQAVPLLNSLPISYLLTNGKVEKQLKFFIGAAWEKSCNKNAYVMDKWFSKTKQVYEMEQHKAIENNMDKGFSKKMVELDLLAFKDAIPQFWIEAKCSFIDDHNDLTGSAKRAIVQVQSNKASLPNCLQSCPGYIVHFTLSLVPINDPLLPNCVIDKFARIRKKVGLSNLPFNHLNVFNTYYLQQLNLAGLGHNHAVIKLCATPLTYALIIKVC